ncbi:MAG TPA: NADH-quinone oxidoreductase subunit C [Candidatus Omnitrophota bacterium]|nr:NADH-quinone oxidoreductase subunit C [Candidatus Omnitrophota bacterium]HPD84240.1 NADH-quinone oxidoreductase subunit C [Candidatus Omnitrophota bacterium]HRZ03096.1 NADH-quinone oxidoreductase subunit C [Candidatus Omnitrophota bacterium]
MDCAGIINEIKAKFPGFSVISAVQNYPDEICLYVRPEIFKDTCLVLHKILLSPVKMLFALDERKMANKFTVHCVFLSAKSGQWVTVAIDVPAENPCFDSLAKSIYSASLFEREIYEMFGIKPEGNPDLRRLRLHDEVWPQGSFPLRKDFAGAPKNISAENLPAYKFSKVEGNGIFEVPVGPVHAGIIGPGHFRFSVAGEPIINLEIRLGFTHRGVEKLFEGKFLTQALRLAESVDGESAFAHSLAFTQAAEKIAGISISLQAAYARAIFLELERMYNHANDIGGIAVDVGFSFPAAIASIIKESILQLNEKLTGSRYLKGINTVGGVLRSPEEHEIRMVSGFLKEIKKDFNQLAKILTTSVSFMDRVDTTGVLKKKTAEDIGVAGLAGRACGIALDLRKNFAGVYHEAKFKMAVEQSGDVLARLRVRIAEFEESMRLVEFFLSKITPGETAFPQPQRKEGEALGFAESWRGPVLYWLKTDCNGAIERCKIVDASFCNWQGLSYAVLGNIIPDFPLCNKSFDLSYPGNDL